MSINNNNIFKHSGDLVFITFIAFGFVLLYFSTFNSLATTFWSTDEQGHGPLILMISLFLTWVKRDSFVLDENQSRPHNVFAYVIFILGLLVFIFSKLLELFVAEVLSYIIVIVGILALFIGFAGVKKLWFPLFFLIFMVPLPFPVVDMLTMPMKIAVSSFAEMILYNIGYPIARDGVILQIGFYKLLVADACAGLHTVFTLEAMGLLYLHLIKRDSFFRNVALAALIVPISFLANTIRVITLVLITYYLGDEVGQGFIHEFAGFVLFGVALVFIILVDTVIHFFERKYRAYKEKAHGVF